MAHLISQAFKRHPVLKVALPLVVLAGLGLVAAYVTLLRASGKAWVPFPLSLVLTEECAHAFFIELDVLNRGCLKLTLSRGLGYAMIVASAGLKLPMVLNMLDAGSTMGLSTSSLSLESTGLASSFSSAIKKGHAFSLWGEVLIVFVQNVLILLLCLRYTGGKDPSVLVFLALAAFTIGANVLPVPPDALIAFGTAVNIASRVPQLIVNYRNKHTGVLSVVTAGLQVVGIVARLFTYLVETSDPAQILSYSIALVMNASILSQVILYWDNTKKEIEKSKARKAD